MTFCLTTLAITLGYYKFFNQRGIHCFHQRLILTGLFLCAQIIITELILGILGWLYLPALIMLNMAVTAAVGFWPCKNSAQPSKGGIGKSNASEFFAAENVVLIVLMCFVVVWTLVKIWLLPSTAFDELAYHLTPVYEYIIHHKIFLLPVKFYTHFSFPQNVELLFLWPAIFSHSQQFVHLVQFFAAFGGMAVIYGLARALDIKPKVAFFVSSLFIFTPLVLIQMNSCYIDIVVCVFFIAVIYFALMFYQTSSLIYFYAASFAAGLLLGMKYNQILFLLTILTILMGRKSIASKHWIASVGIIVVCGGYWYLRNWIFLHTFFYTPEKFEEFDLFPIQEPLIKLLNISQDIGLGKIDGGFGLIFWGLAAPSWFYCVLKGIVKKKREEEFFVWTCLPIFLGIVQLLMVNREALIRCPRYSLFIVPLALLGLGRVLTIFDKITFFKRIVQGICIVCAFYNLFPAVKPIYPVSELSTAIQEKVQGNYLTKMHYSYSTYRKHPSQAWALLDYLTATDTQGLSCYIATYDRRPLTSAVYGSRLQNRLWNLEEENWQTPPDVFMYTFGYGLEGQKLEYYGPEIRPEDVSQNSEYTLLLGNKGMQVYIRKDYIEQPEKKLRLKIFQKYFRSSPVKVSK